METSIAGRFPTHCTAWLGLEGEQQPPPRCGHSHQQSPETIPGYQSPDVQPGSTATRCRKAVLTPAPQPSQRPVGSAAAS